MIALGGGHLVRARGEVHGLQELLRLRVVLGQPAQLGEERDVLLRRELVVERVEPVGETSGSTDMRDPLQVFRRFLDCFCSVKAVWSVWNPKTVTLPTAIVQWLADGQI